MIASEDKKTLGVITMWLIALLALLSIDPFVNSPDLGWHIRSGEEILKRQQVPLTAWFTFTVPDFPWINHEWLQDIGLTLIWSYTGEAGLRIFYASLGLSILVFWLYSFYPPQSRSQFTKALCLIVLAIVLIATRALRAQFFTLFFFSLVFALLNNSKKSIDTKKSLALPVIFFIWANVHGGFPIGFLLIGLFIISEVCDCLLRKSSTIAELFPKLAETPQYKFKDLIWLSASGFLSFLVTLINPYGWRIYQEIFRTVSDSFPSQVVAEWLPTTLASHTGEAFYFTAAVLLYLLLSGRIRRDITPGQLFLIGTFFLFGMSATRHAIFFVVTAIPIFLSEVAKLSVYLERERRSLLASIILLTILSSGVYFTTRLTSAKDRISSKEQLYPLKAIDELSSLLVQKRVFHSVDWGGMLLLTVDQFKTFIDGRMTQWQVDGESFLRTYVSIKDAESGWEKKLEKYQVDLVFIKNREPLVKELRQRSASWEIIYEDTRAIAFKKKV
jgi:hypothetical protein